VATGFELDVAVGPATARVSSVEVGEFKRAVGSFATGVTVVTLRLGDGGRAHGFTANSFTSVSLDPPLVAVCLARQSPSLAQLQPGEGFVVNVLAAHQRGLCEQFARPAEDKFAGVSWRAGLVGVPVLDGCLASIECHLERWFYGGDHVILLGGVRRVDSVEGDPLLVHRGGYLGSNVG
jgi:flavin reductase (DIM6/NTAB) family NADH-FMN oxidoreductase RutF